MAAIVEKMLPDVTGEGRHGQITVDTWFDRLMKALTVWLPLLVSGTLFLGEITGEPQNVLCYPPSNFTIPQANYLNGFCKSSLVSERVTSSMFPYFVLMFALLMYIPHLLWKVLLGTKLASEITNIMGEIERSWKKTNSMFTMPSIDVRIAIAGGCMPSHSRTIGLITSGKWRKFQMAKITFLAIFAFACLTYLIWFDIVSQKNDIFVCSAKLSSKNGTRDDEYLDSVCKVVGNQYLFYVSIFLSMAFCISMLLPIYFVLYIKLTRNIFLLDVLNSLKILVERITGGKIKQLPKKISPFSDFSIISRLCGENRHISPCLNEILNIDTGPGPDIWVDTGPGPDIWVDRAQGKSKEAAGIFNLRDLEAFFRLAADQNSDADSGATGGAAAGRTHDVEADIHPQPPSPGSSSSFLRFHTEDETRPKGPTGEETVPLVYHRGRKNKSNPIEKETSI